MSDKTTTKERNNIRTVDKKHPDGKKIPNTRQIIPDSLEYGITDNEYILVEKVLKDPLMNATRAYLELHPDLTAKEASRKASAIMNTDSVMVYFKHRLDKRMEKAAVTETEIIFNLKALALRCMQAEEVKDSDGHPTGEYKFEPNSAIKAWELLGKNLGMFKEKVELSGPAGGPIVMIDKSMTQAEAFKQYMANLKSTILIKRSSEQ